MLITSIHNPRIKDAAALREGRNRRERNRILIDGAREIALAIQARVRLLEAYVCEELCTTEDARRAVALLPQAGAEVLTVAPAAFAKLAYGARVEGIVAVAETPHTELADLRLPERALVAVLEGIEKPGNVGAVLRTADAAGVHAAILVDGRTDLYNPNAIRASLGAIFTVPVCAASGSATFRWLIEQSCQIVTARVNAERDYADVDLRRSTAIVLGSEQGGLSDRWTGPEVIPVRLPLHGRVDSLNVSAAGAILFYEALRQRGATDGTR